MPSECAECAQRRSPHVFREIANRPSTQRCRERGESSNAAARKSVVDVALAAWHGPRFPGIRDVDLHAALFQNLVDRNLINASGLRREVPAIAQDLNNPLTPILRTMLAELMDRAQRT